MCGPAAVVPAHRVLARALRVAVLAACELRAACVPAVRGRGAARAPRAPVGARLRLRLRGRAPAGHALGGLPLTPLPRRPAALGSHLGARAAVRGFKINLTKHIFFILNSIACFSQTVYKCKKYSVITSNRTRIVKFSNIVSEKFK